MTVAIPARQRNRRRGGRHLKEDCGVWVCPHALLLSKACLKRLPSRKDGRLSNPLSRQVISVARGAARSGSSPADRMARPASASRAWLSRRPPARIVAAPLTIRRRRARGLVGAAMVERRWAITIEVRPQGGGKPSWCGLALGVRFAVVLSSTTMAGRLRSPAMRRRCFSPPRHSVPPPPTSVRTSGIRRSRRGCGALHAAPSRRRWRWSLPNALSPTYRGTGVSGSPRRCVGVDWCVPSRTSGLRRRTDPVVTSVERVSVGDVVCPPRWSGGATICPARPRRTPRRIDGTALRQPRPARRPPREAIDTSDAPGRNQRRRPRCVP